MTFTVENVSEALAALDKDQPVHLRVRTADGEFCVPVTAVDYADGDCVELVGHHQAWQPDPDLAARIDAFLADPSGGVYRERPSRLG